MGTRGVGIAIAALVLLGPAGVRGSEELPGAGPVVPVLHEEMSRSLTDLVDQIQGFGVQLREHFTPRDLPRERPLISIILSHRAELDLSPAQVEALERLRAEFRKDAIRADADLKIADTDLATLLAADPVDLGRVEAKVREIEKRRADVRLARIRTIEEGRAQLTADQREKLRTLLAEGRPPGMRAVPPPPPGAPNRL